LTDIGIATGSPSWLRLARRAKLLATLTLVWLGIEGTVGVVAGISAGSIALVAFGLDSAIEGLASVIVIWRFTGTRTISKSAERRAQKWVGVSFFLLTPYVAAEAIETLIEGAAAETSWLGIALTAGTLILCPWLGRANSGSANNWDHAPPTARGRKTCCAPFSRRRCWSASRRTPCLVSDGLIRLSRWRSRQCVSAKVKRRGVGKSAGAPHALNLPQRVSTSCVWRRRMETSPCRLNSIR